MFPATHLYILKKILKYPDDLNCLGSVFPDVMTSKRIKWHESHTGALSFYKSLPEHLKKKYIGFFKGYFSHAVDTKGVDYYGDKKYKNFDTGYSFELGKKIEEDALNVCGVRKEASLWAAHNFIEMGVEIILTSEDKTLSPLIYNAVENAPREIIKFTAQYFKTEENIVKESLDRFLSVIPREAPDEAVLASKYAKVLKARHGVEKVDLNEVKSLIVEAKNIVKGSYKEFISFCVDNISKFINNFKS
ncbi:MAG: hypothetical protein ABIH00_01955 [Armatimonadota bacterium]